MSPAPSSVRPAWPAILAAGLICGVLDIAAAFLSAYLAADRSPPWVLRAVASAVLGRDLAFGGGAWVPALGLAMHFLVATTWAAVFTLLSRRFPALLRHVFVAGPLFGLFVYWFMNGITIPFCSWLRSLYLGTPVSWAHAPFGWPQFCIHLTCVGLAIALAVRHWSRPAA
jgi:hypothetical protein